MSSIAQARSDADRRQCVEVMIASPLSRSGKSRADGTRPMWQGKAFASLINRRRKAGQSCARSRWVFGLDGAETLGAVQPPLPNAHDLSRAGRTGERDA